MKNTTYLINKYVNYYIKYYFIWNVLQSLTASSKWNKGTITV